MFKPAYLLSLGLFAAGVAVAATDTTQFDVKLTITESCEIAAQAATDVDFGTEVRRTSGAPVTANGALVINCSDGTPYEIGLNDGNNNREMTDGTTLVPYGLYQDASRTVAWDNSANTLGGTGTATDQTIPIYGSVPSLDFPAGVYTDTVVATVTY